MLLIVQVIDIGIINVPLIRFKVPYFILRICHVGAQSIFCTCFYQMFILEAAKIVNLANLLDSMRGIERVTVVIRASQDRYYCDVVVRTVRISVD